MSGWASAWSVRVMVGPLCMAGSSRHDCACGQGWGLAWLGRPVVMGLPAVHMVRRAEADMHVVVARVEVRHLGAADLVGEAGQGDTVRAGVAIHPDVAAHCLVISLKDKVSQFVAVADELGCPQVEFIGDCDEL